MNIFKKEFHKLLSRSGFVFLCRISGAVIAFVTQIMLARWMGATELGIYVYAFSLAMLLSTLASLGFPAASLRFISEYLASGKTAFINGFLAKGRLIILLSSLCIGLIAFTILMALSVSLSVIPIKAIGSDLAFTVLITLSESLGDYFMPVVLSFVCIPFIALFRFHDRVAHAFSWFALSFLPSMTVRPLVFLIALFIIWRLVGHLSAEIAMIVQFCVIFVVTIVQYILLRPRLKKTINNQNKEFDLRFWFRVSMPLLFITIFTQYFPELSIIIIGTDLPPDQIAIYNASYRVALLIGFVYNSVSAAIVPKASQLHAKGDVLGMQHYITHATQLNFFLSVVGVVIFVFGGELLLGFFGKEFIAGYPALLILAVAQLFLAGVGPVAILLNITGHQDKCFFVFGVSIVLAVLLEHYLVVGYGLIGAASMVLLVVIFWSIWLHILVRRYVKIHASILSIILTKQTIN